MKKNVVITVRGLQRQVAEDEPVEVISAGTYLRKDDTHYLSYEEADEDGKLTKNRIKVTPSSVEMIKQGGITTQMIFVTGQKHYACYETPFGELTLGMTTKSVDVMEEENQISVALRYDLEINDTHMSECELDIEVKECMAG
ncbi:MAG: DUF1934 domain-containing protein [Lachnospiraceae bacterium]|nr:DUF1934 domain-containing protein [Lachnospiraceae bacterium]